MIGMPASTAAHIPTQRAPYHARIPARLEACAASGVATAAAEPKPEHERGEQCGVAERRGV